jgi:hypothetical protein
LIVDEYLFFTIWHYLRVIVTLLLIALGILIAKRQENQKIVLPMIFSIVLIVILIATITLVALDKYTKKVAILNINNHRILTTERIVYTGRVKNVDDYTIGTVSVEIKLVNNGHATGKVKTGSFYKASGFADFFGGGANVLYQPQTITKKFAVATDLQPNRSESFRVVFDYPAYFHNVTDFASATAH